VNAVLADTFFYIALVSETDLAHDRAVEWTHTFAAPVITTVWVITEVADALAAPNQRGIFLELFHNLQADPSTTILPPAQDLFDAGMRLYARRPDKEWSLTDCISFAVMEQFELYEALTADRRFEQAGFKALLI
jgi:predicted nucleic acid-binding protein